jgi:type VI secretion system protein ImpM
MVKPQQRRIAWWGKLPARGDFIGRGLPTRWRREWEDWLQRGLALAAATLDADALRQRMRAFAPWRYLVLSAPGEIWCGILAPSHDRVARVYPLTLAERFTSAASPRDCAARLQSLLAAAAEGPEALEASIAALPPPTAHAFEPAEPWPLPPSSLWWPLEAADDELALVATWPPEPPLLLELLGIGRRESP